MDAPSRPISDLSAAQFRAVANAMPNLAWMADPDGWIIWYNQRWYDYTGTTPEEMAGWGWQSVHHPDVLPEMLKRWTQALKSGDRFDWAFPLRRGSDGSYRQFMTRAEPLREEGQIIAWLGTNTDITEMERTKERLQLVVNELNHRVKNTLAMVQSIARNTFRDSDPEATKTFERRLFALSDAHDELTSSGWSGSSLRELIARVIATFGPDKFVLEGPDTSVAPNVVSPLVMTIHELCTNAIKYGSLSATAGVVNIRWSVEYIETRAWLTLLWAESDGPLVKPPSKTSFGLKLIMRSTTSESGAVADHRFEPDGVRCEIRFPINEIKV